MKYYKKGKNIPVYTYKRHSYLYKRIYTDLQVLLTQFMKELHLHHKDYKVYYSLQCQTNYYAFPMEDLLARAFQSPPPATLPPAPTP